MLCYVADFFSSENEFTTRRAVFARTYVNRRRSRKIPRFNVRVAVCTFVSSENARAHTPLHVVPKSNRFVFFRMNPFLVELASKISARHDGRRADI